ncbi:hypothetical protein LguiB_005998 [Lonicera macranthoides]
MKEVAMELEAIKMSKGASTIQQHYEDVEYEINEFPESWETASNSTSTSTSTRHLGDLEERLGDIEREIVEMKKEGE